MSTLQEQLEREVQKRGQDSPVAQLLRNQIAAEKSGQGLRELYLTGSVKMLEQIMTEQEQKSPTLAAKQRRLLEKLEQAKSDCQK